MSDKGKSTATIEIILAEMIGDSDIRVWEVTLGERHLSLIRQGRGPVTARLVAPGAASETAGFTSRLDLYSWFGLMVEGFDVNGVRVRLGDVLLWTRDTAQEEQMLSHMAQAKLSGGAGSPLAFPARGGRA